MTPTQNAKLNTVLKSNTKWPLIIVGMIAAPAANATIVPADIAERDLHNDTLPIKPYIVIDGLDTVPAPHQDKFIPLLKDRRIGTRKLPAHIRIVIPVRRGDKLSDEIKKLSLIYNV